MNRWIVLGCIAGLLASSLPGMALPKPKVVKRVSVSAAGRYYRTRPQVRTASLPRVTYHPAQAQRTVAHQVHTALHTPISAQTIYTDQATLAQDIVAMYRGKQAGQAAKDPFGRVVVLYELPQQAITYAPYGREARLLNPSEEMLVYNPTQQRGQLVKKGVVNQLYTLSQTVVEAMPAPQAHPVATPGWTGKSLYQSQAELAQDVAAWRGIEGGIVAKGPLGENVLLYELPKVKIEYEPYGRMNRTLDPELEMIEYDPVRQRGKIVFKKAVASLYTLGSSAGENAGGLVK